MSIALTLPSTLVGLSNGRRISERDNGDGTTTTRWEVSYPINNYLVTFNAAPYVAIEEVYRGARGDLALPILFWAIPEHLEKARALWREAPELIATLARRFGEYPFLDDKLWVAQAPYLGMEHQTLVAYGADFEPNAFGFDELLLHELAHEWWGNKVSVADWADFWIHEGFATYAEALYVLDTAGEARYLDYLRGITRRIRNREPIAGGRDLTAAQAYRSDIYPKGAATLHSLKWLVGDEAFFELLHRFANDARFAYRTVSTADFERLVGEVAGQEFPWFFDVYLRRAAPPRWTMARGAAARGVERLDFAWDDPAFELPLPLEVAGERRRLPMPGGRGTLEVEAGTLVAVDPRGLVYAESAE
jgi:aminopeptidase N